MMVDGIYSRKIDVRKLNTSIVKKFEAHPELVAMLDEWVLVPDNDHLPELIKAAKVIRQIQPPKLPVVLYRGFSVSNSYQDHMGLADKGWFSSKLKPGVMGKTQQFSLMRPLSFTTNLAVARGFGDTVVQIQSVAVREHCVWLSDELSFAISERRGLKEAESQDEVIVLPTVKTLAITVMSPESQSRTW